MKEKIDSSEAEKIQNAINDLHDSNIGYNHNKPIILDFSGYDRKY